MANEFDLIRKYFAPLADGFHGSLNLTDDAAQIDVPAGMQLVVSMDTIGEGIHFLGNESPDLIARKLLRTNLSDLAAKGASPLCYFLSLSLPSISEAWLSGFAAGLTQDQKTYGIQLAGGDTTRSPGGVCLAMTVCGLVPWGGMIRRSGAKPGDGIYVSGTLGDSALGLMSLRAQRSNPDRIALPPTVPLNNKEYLISRYLLPEPRVELGQKLRGVATSCMDISDGLVQDLGHLCRASGVGAVVQAAAMPLSDAAKNEEGALSAALCGGDDYELLFTAGRDFNPISLPCPVTRIGEITASGNVVVMDECGSEMVLEKKGFQHF